MIITLGDLYTLNKDVKGIGKNKDLFIIVDLIKFPDAKINILNVSTQKIIRISGSVLEDKEVFEFVNREEPKQSKSVICGMQSKIEKQRKEIVRLNQELKWKQQILNMIQIENNNKLLNGIDPKDYELVITSNEDNTEYYNNGVKVDKLNYIKFESEVGSVPVVITRRYVIKDNK